MLLAGCALPPAECLTTTRGPWRASRPPALTRLARLASCADASPSCSSDSVGASCRPETPPRAVSSAPAAAAPALLSPAHTPAAPLPAAAPPAVPLTRLVAASFAEQLQRALLGGVTMTRDECTVVLFLEGMAKRSHAPPPASYMRRAACA